MPEQLLSDFRAPKINGVAAERVLSNELLQNIYQGEIESDGRGVTQTYTADVSGAEIRVLRVLPVKQEARELGAQLNGGGFNNLEAGEVATAEVGIRILTVFDRPIDIPQVTSDMIPVDLLGATIKNYSGLITRSKNAMAIAAKIVKTLGDGAETTPFVVTSKDTVKDCFVTASNRLDFGDVAHDIDIFPDDGRIFTIRPEYKKSLQDAAIFSIGDLAQHMFAKGQVSPGDAPKKTDNGYLGDVYGIPAHMATIATWIAAARFCGLPDRELETIVGYCASHIANSVGVAVDSLIKVSEHPYGRGVRLKPLIRLGAESWYAAGNSFITLPDFSNPFTFLKSLDEKYTPILRGPASRQFSQTIISIEGATVKAADTNVYLGAKHFYAFTKDAAIAPTVQGFKKAYETSGAKIGSDWVNGAEIPLPTTAGSYYLLTLTLAPDGTATVAKSQKTVKVS